MDWEVIGRAQCGTAIIIVIYGIMFLIMTQLINKKVNSVNPKDRRQTAYVYVDNKDFKNFLGLIELDISKHHIDKKYQPTQPKVTQKPYI